MNIEGKASLFFYFILIFELLLIWVKNCCVCKKKKKNLPSKNLGIKKIKEHVEAKELVYENNIKTKTKLVNHEIIDELMCERGGERERVKE